MPPGTRYFGGRAGFLGMGKIALSAHCNNICRTVRNDACGSALRRLFPEKRGRVIVQRVERLKMVSKWCTRWCGVVALLPVLVLAQAVQAQPEQGPGSGPGGPGRFRGSFMRSGSGFGAGAKVRLATIDEVKKALKLTDEQEEQVEELNKELRDDFRTVLQGGGGPEGIQKINEDAAAKLDEVLDDEQEERLRGITIQIIGPNVVLVDAEVAKELKITDEQKAKLEEVQQENMREMGETFRASGTPDEGNRKKFEELREKGQKRLLDVLTSDQQEQLNAMKGEEVKIDMMKLRGGGSGMRFRGGRGERGPDGRFGSGRDRAESSKDSAEDGESKSE
jgi:Spy/CpxP family protein refolding chaperone